MPDTHITMSQRELGRLEVIQNLIQKNINGTEASKQLHLTVRQVKRLKKRVKQHGAKGLLHQLRGKKSNRALATRTADKIVTLIRATYPDCGPTFVHEKLVEKHGVTLSVEAVRTIMIAAGLWKARKRTQHVIRTWRPRKEHFGEMEQFDGSYHVWFGNEESCLLASIDDAAGTITGAQFEPNEGVVPVFSFWNAYVRQNGAPNAIYLDKYSTYKINHKNAVDNKELMTQFERAAKEVSVRLITAHSPQAKGRIERLFRTLQDRLVKELRLAGITTQEAANVFLKDYIPLFNEKFGVVPAARGNVHRKLTKQEVARLPCIFSRKSTRVVHNDYTVRFESQYYQLSQKQPTTIYKKDRVLIEEHLNGSLVIRHRGHALNYTILPERPQKIIAVNLPAITMRKQSDWKPPKNHPWRRQANMQYAKQRSEKQREMTRA
jgi:hypothetical protein